MADGGVWRLHGAHQEVTCPWTKRDCRASSLANGVDVSLGGDGPPLPPFAAALGVRDAAAVPLTVDGIVVAVLYTDATPSDACGIRWPLALEVLPAMRAACSK